MSNIALVSPATGTATFSITTPSGTSTDRTLTLPDSAGTLATSESTLAQFNASGSAPVYACRAWVNFDGTGTVAIRASGNVSSITDNGTGDYTVNFTTAMPDANYCAVALSGGVSGGSYITSVDQITARSTTAMRVLTLSILASLQDAAFVELSFFR
jgi:hypothetical protein